MKEDGKIKNKADDKKNIYRPVCISVAVFIVIIAVLIWFGITRQYLYSNIRDFIITANVFLLFILNAAVAVLCFSLASRIDSAKVQISLKLTEADGKVEDLADKIADILKKILDPFITMKSRSAGILHIFSKNKSE